MASQFNARNKAQRRYPNQQAAENCIYEASELQEEDNEEDSYEDDDDDDDEDANPVDRIRRSYHAHKPTGAARQPSQLQQQHQQSSFAARIPETIQVNLNESYFASERQFVLNSLANARQKLSSLQLFNPAQNGSVKQRQQQEEWTEKEKYTLDSLNEFKSPLDERFQWNKPDDGREVWPSKLQYFMAITSYSIGLGNVIRFPILVQKNGGLAFIIPFVIMLLLEGIPLFYLELAIGQRTRRAAISCWNLVSPFAAGIGLASAAVSFLIGLYYNTMVAWTLLYTWASLTNGLPQATSSSTSTTDQDTSSFTPACPSAPLAAATTVQAAAAAGELNNSSSSSGSSAMLECQLASPFEFYWYRKTLDVSASVSDWGHFNWRVAVCLSLAWLISYLCLVKGLSTSKRLVYAVSTFPYVILLIFLCKALTLRGMEQGIAYLFEPNWPKLFDPYVWLQAAAQVFFSLGLGFGGLIALSSYNPVNNNCYKDAIKVSLINFGTSLLAGLVVFSILGFRAQLQHDKCQLEREQQIDFYLADYNLKVLEYGAIFKQVSQQQQQQQQRQQQRSESSQVDKSLPGDNIEQFMAIREKSSKSKQQDQDNATTESAEEEKEDDNNNDDDDNNNATSNNDDDSDDFSLEDAIDSIANLDKQLDRGSASGSFDYGDSDTEFILNASSLIDRAELDKIIENIQNLPRCSVKRELDASTQGTGLVFVVMAEAISAFDSHSHTWAILFFLMLLTLGLDSQFGNLEGLLSSLTDFNYNLSESKQAEAGGESEEHDHGMISAHHDHDHDHDHDDQMSNGARVSSGGATTTKAATGLSFASPGRRALREASTKLQANQLIRTWATGLICCLSLALSLVIFAHGAGSHMFAIFDEYASNFSLILIALFELLAISYIYGLKTFCDDCELMTGKRPPFLVLLSWRYISPIVLMILVLATIKQFTVELNYDVWNVFYDAEAPSSDTTTGQHLESKQWPAWSIMFGVALILSCVIWIPLVAILRIMRINLIPDEQHRRWFPVDELKEFHQLQDQEHQVTRLERILFGFKQDDD